MEAGEDSVEYKQGRDDGKEHRHEGRPEVHEGYDRRPGTGRGRGARKDGHGKGNWGKAGEEVKAAEGETPTTWGETTEGEATEKPEKVEKKPEPEPETEYDIQKRKIREEEDKVKTLDDYKSSKKFAGIKATGREADKFNEKNVAEDGNAQDDRRIGKQSNVLIYNVGQLKSGEAELLGFQAGGDDEFDEPRRGGRGGRGGRGRGDRAPADGARRGGRGGKLKVTEQDFPSLS
jgi:plasminogen activator inhibitor 1 RNA-binding protein